jgi:cytochrome c-type biogenesis protein CcmH
MKHVLLAAFLFLSLADQARAVDPDEMLKDPALETRARNIGQQLRCLVCQNESIDDSNADLARDLRKIVRERLVAGDSDEQAIGFLRARYGDFVLLKPPFEPATWALWLGPPSILLLGAAFAFVVLGRHRAGSEDRPLSEAERRALEALK